MFRPSPAAFAVLCAAVFGGAAASADPVRSDAAILATVRFVEAVDTDGDGLTDDSEARYRTDPFAPDTDGDGLSDGDEAVRLNTSPTIADSDGDGYSDGEEVEAGTDPLNPLSHPGSHDDLDGNGLPDAWERRHFGRIGTDPSADPDSDGLSNAEEYAEGTNPVEYDTDGDGMGDGNELYYGHDPLVPHEPPLAFTAVEPQPDGSVLLRWSTMYGLGYLPQFKDAIDVPVWSNLVRRVIWEGSSWPSGEQSVLDRDAPKHPARFYRILTVDDE